MSKETKIDEQPLLQKHSVSGSFISPHDRFKNTALFLCGYLSYPRVKVDEVAGIIKRYSNLKEPYELCICQKCKIEVELEFYEGDDDECPPSHYNCPNCRANYCDKKGNVKFDELDDHDDFSDRDEY